MLGEYVKHISELIYVSSREEDSSCGKSCSLHVVFLFVVSALFFLFLSSLFWYHSYLILRNRSTLEQFRAPVFGGHGSADARAYDLGMRKNVEQVFGANPIMWFLPLRSTLGDGMSYPRSESTSSAGHFESLCGDGEMEAVNNVGMATTPNSSAVPSHHVVLQQHGNNRLVETTTRTTRTEGHFETQV